MSEVISPVAPSDSGFPESSVDSQESDPLTWPEAQTLFVDLTLEDFLCCIEASGRNCSKEASCLLDFFPSSIRKGWLPPLAHIPLFAPSIDKHHGLQSGSMLDIFEEAVRWYIRRHVDRSGA